MKIQNWRRLTRTDYPDVPRWMDKILDAINRVLENVVRALQNNLSHADNFPEPPRTLKMPHDTVVPIQLQKLKQVPLGVQLVWSDYFDYPRIAAEMHPTRPLTVNVKVKWDTPPDTDPEVTLVFLPRGDDD